MPGAVRLVMSASARSVFTNGLVNLGDADAGTPADVYSSPTKVGPVSPEWVSEMLSKATASERHIPVRAPDSRVVPKMGRERQATEPPPSLWFADDEEASFEPTVVKVDATPAAPAAPAATVPATPKRAPAMPPPLPAAARNAVPPPALPSALPPVPVERYLNIAAPPAHVPAPTAPSSRPQPALAAPAVPAPRKDPWLLVAVVSGTVAVATLVPALYLLLT
jgi:hypothetical protein